MTNNTLMGRVVTALLLGLAIWLYTLLDRTPTARSHGHDPCGGTADNNCTGTATPIPTCQPVWNVVPVPAAGGQDNLFTAVAGSAATNVWAVGWFANTQQVGAPHNTLIEHWNGIAWQAVGSPNVAGAGNELTGVATLAADDAWAVGSYSLPGDVRHTLVLHWDGWAWGLVPSPDGQAPNSVLTGIAALSPADIWAVGVTGDATTTHTLVEHWDGTRWATVPSPDNAGGGTLTGIAALAADNVWAVGAGPDSQGTAQALVEHWDGATWQIVPGPPAARLTAVTGIAPADIWVVGQAADGGPLIAHWDGTIWHPMPQGVAGTLDAITALTAPDVWVGGTGLDTTGKAQPLILHWNGVSWQVVPSPDPDAVQTSGIAGLAAFGPRDVWAVGRRDLQEVAAWQPLADHYSANMGSACATRTATATATVTATATMTATATATAPAVATAVTAVTTATATATATICPLTFGDVPPSAYFAGPVQYLACRGVIGGYADGTFRPYLDTTRGQLAKIITLAYALPLPPAAGDYRFADNPPGGTFFPYIEAVAARAVVGGYPCGGVNPQTGSAEPCDGQHRPYYRSGNAVTRAQLTRIVVGTAQQIAGWPLLNPPAPTFSDVAPGSPFYPYVETAACHGVLGGYADGTFRPGHPATRGQIAKMVYNAVSAAGGCPLQAKR